VAVFIGGGTWLGFTAFSCCLLSTVLSFNSFKDTESVKKGLAGYNAYLVGCAFATFVNPDWNGGTYFAALFFAVVASVLDLSLKRAFGPSVPTFTFAFNFSASVGLLVWRPYMPSLIPWYSGDNAGVAFLVAVFSGVSQVFIVQNPISGALIILGCFIESWRIALPLLVFTLVGTCVGLSIDSMSNVSTGIYGYNSALLGCVFAVHYAPAWVSLILGLMTSVLTAFLFFGISFALNQAFELPSLTFAFCFSATACHLILNDGPIRGLSARAPQGPDIVAAAAQSQQSNSTCHEIV